ALAVTYCQLRCGQLPFPDHPKTFSGNFGRHAPDLSMLPEAERPILARALAPVPMDRWPSCQEFIARLQKLMRQQPGTIASRSSRAKVVNPTSGRDRRASPRYPCSISTSCRLLGKQHQTFWPAAVQDISQGGLGLVTDVHLKQGTILLIMLALAGGRYSRPLIARVKRATKQAGGDWLLGCTWACKLTDEEIQALFQSVCATPQTGETGRRTVHSVSHQGSTRGLREVVCLQGG